MIDLTTQAGFSESFREINRSRLERLQQTADTRVKQDLLRDGIAVCRNAFHADEISTLIAFQGVIETCLGGPPDCGGYINVAASLIGSSLHVRGASLDRVHPNHGQARLQTKSMNFPMPGFADVSQHPLIRSMFFWWHDNTCDVSRGTMEWIVPSDINHNGWHKDTVRPQLKAFVLLGEVNEMTAPMYYARGSHLMQTDFESQIGWRLAVNGTGKIDTSVPRWGKHYPALTGANSGYLGDDVATNFPASIDDMPVILGGTSYEKTVCVGSPGDVIFFDSCGFHSGNRSHGETRRTIALSSPSRSIVASSLDAVGVAV